MNRLIKLEELAMFGLSIFMFSKLDLAWWWFLVLILLPDLSMIGYLFNPKVGAVLYNLFHHKAFGIVVWIIGVSMHFESLELAGIILFGHSSMDRIFGYGLKYADNFHHTHLGLIGNNKKS